MLFTSEADASGDLDEYSWNGKDVRWIERARDLTLDPKKNVKASIEVTQLPYPPIFALEAPERQNDVRDKYMIGAGNYGIYVYRNRRLLSWAESLGLIPQDQDLYSFRARLLIDESADEALNIDVKKTQFHPSEIAQQALGDAIYQYRRKSSQAWNTASAERNRRTNEDAHGLANDIADRTPPPEELPGLINDQRDLDRADQRQREIEDEDANKARELAEGATGQEPADEAGSEPTEDQIHAAVAGPTAGKDDRILLVENIRDNTLWEPMYYAGKQCVRINKIHRFATLVYEVNRKNTPLTVFFNLFLLQLATADTYLQKQAQSESERKEVDQLLSEFRRVASEYLAHLCRNGDELLPRE